MRILIVVALISVAGLDLATPSTQELRETSHVGRQVMLQFSESTATGMNPILVLGVGGAYRYCTAEPDARVHFFDHPAVFGTLLTIMLLVFLKDRLNLIPFAGRWLKKPLDGLAHIVHVAGGFVGLLAIGTHAYEDGGAGEAVVCVIPYTVVFSVFNLTEAATTLNPFPFVDTGLKLARTLLVGLVVLLTSVYPVIGFALALVIFLVCLVLLHFSIRVQRAAFRFTLDWLFGAPPQPGESVKVFSCWGFAGVPWFSCGRIQDGQFVYKRLFLFWERSVPLGDSVGIAAGTLNPYLLSADKAALLRFSPRYLGREDELCKRFNVPRLEDISIQARMRRALALIRRRLFGGSPAPSAVA
jgi:hypothetical protein